MLHELGHMLGVDGDTPNYGLVAVMNYLPAAGRFSSKPYTADVGVLGNVYRSNAVSRTDLGVYLYNASPSNAGATYPSSVVAGSNLTFGDYTVENVGTTTIPVPRVEWYLSKARNFISPYYSLGVRTY